MPRCFPRPFDHERLMPGLEVEPFAKVPRCVTCIFDEPYFFVVVDLSMFVYIYIYIFFSSLVQNLEFLIIGRFSKHTEAEETGRCFVDAEIHGMVSYCRFILLG